MLFPLLLLCVSYFAYSQLFGITTHSVQLVSIDPATAKLTPIGPVYDDLFTLDYEGALDQKNQIIYGMALNQTGEHKYHVYGLSLKDGKLVYNIYTPFIITRPMPIALEIDVDPETGDCFIVGREEDQNDHIYRVDVKNNIWTEIAKVTRSGAVDDYIGKDNGVFYIQFGNPAEKMIEIWGFDVKTGEKVCQINNTVNMFTMDFDPKTNKVWGFGVDRSETPRVESLVTLDEKNKLERLFHLAPYFGDSNAIAAINVKGREIYGDLVLQKEGNPQEIHLVTVDMDSGKIKSSPIGGGTKTLEYLNV